MVRKGWRYGHRNSLIQRGRKLQKALASKVQKVLKKRLIRMSLMPRVRILWETTERLVSVRPFFIFCMSFFLTLTHLRMRYRRSLHEESHQPFDVLRGSR